jgi:hypothetical protein
MKLANGNQVKAIHTLVTTLGIDDKEYREMLDGYGVVTSKKLSFGQAGDFITKLSTLVRVDAARKQYTPRPAGTPLKGETVKVYGTGERNDITKKNLTDEQADRIEILRLLLNWDTMRLSGFLYRQTGELRAIQMLMNYQATKVITGMTKVLACSLKSPVPSGTPPLEKGDIYRELNNMTNRQLKDLYEKLQRNKIEKRANCKG